MGNAIKKRAAPAHDDMEMHRLRSGSEPPRRLRRGRVPVAFEVEVTQQGRELKRLAGSGQISPTVPAWFGLLGTIIISTRCMRVQNTSTTSCSVTSK